VQGKEADAVDFDPLGRLFQHLCTAWGEKSGISAAKLLIYPAGYRCRGGARPLGRRRGTAGGPL